MEVHQALPLRIFQSNLKFDQTLECSKIYLSDHNDIFQKKIVIMCKILLWLVEYILNERTSNFKLDQNMVNGMDPSEWVSD